MRTIVRFGFPAETEQDVVEQDACLAIFTSECIHGRPRARLEVSYLAEAGGQRCVFDIRGVAGETALQVFVGLCAERFGEDGFSFESLPASGPRE